MMIAARRRREAAAAVEAACIFPGLMLLLVGLIVGGNGVQHFQQISCIAQEAARYTSVHGADYSQDNNVASPSASQIQSAAVIPLAIGMDSSQITTTVQLIDQGTGAVVDWDSSNKSVRSISVSGEYVNNTVRVTVVYIWSPGVLLSPITMTGVCELPLAY